MKKRKRGMTLIEVIVAMALVGIISVSLLTVFSTGFTLIALAGNKSEMVFTTHGEIEAALRHKSIDSTPSNIVLTFSSDNSTIIPKGNIEVFSQEIGKGTTSITIFKPKY